MDRAEFWRLIGRTRPEDADCDAHAEALTDQLATLEPEEIVSFEQHFLSLMNELHRAHVAAVAGMVLGLVSTDGFEDFCGWVILQGRTVVDDLLNSPRKVARHFPAGVDPSCEGALVAATVAYDQRTGQPVVPIDNQALPERVNEPPLSDDEIRARFPELWQRFVEGRRR